MRVAEGHALGGKPVKIRSADQAVEAVGGRTSQPAAGIQTGEAAPVIRKNEKDVGGHFRGTRAVGQARHEQNRSPTCEFLNRGG